MTYDNCYLNLKNDFENLNNSLLSEGIDEIVCRCFKQVKDNINYLNDHMDLENINSLNNESNYVERSFKIKETQQLFKYCILLLEKENNIKPQHKLLLENLLLHFQNIFSLGNNKDDKFKYSKRLYENYKSNDISSPLSSNSSIFPISQYVPLPSFSDLDKQLLYEQNQGK